MAMFNPPHPGGLIAEYLEDNEISLRSLAKQLGVSAASLSKVAGGKASVSPEMAVRLEAGLGIAARLWLSMQSAQGTRNDRRFRRASASGERDVPGARREGIVLTLRAAPITITDFYPINAVAH
ncbi:HigA family addiction module antitoxin [Pantoea vagans]|uniref:HigA family addiction module antitoxin n=1 Tax=Pantoea vagans TaxID=470934 RepID=UPI0039647BCD